MLKICHFITSLKQGGAEKVLSSLLEINYQQPHNKIQHIVITLLSEGQYREIIDKYNIPIYSLALEKRINILSYLFTLKKIISNEKPNIIHAWLLHPIAFILPLTILKNFPPIIWSSHVPIFNWHEEKLQNRILLRIIKIFSFIPKKILYVSKENKIAYEKYTFPQQKSMIIYNGINIGNLPSFTKFDNLNLKQKLNIPLTHHVIGMFARFHLNKDFHTMLQALSILLNKYNSQIILLLAGTEVNSENTKLAIWIKEYNLEMNVKLLDVQKHIEPYISILKVCCLASLAESQPMVLLESMAYGVPCVASDVGGIPELLQNCGYVVPIKNPHKLAESIYHILSLSDEEYNNLSKKNKKKVKNHYSLQNILTQYYALYKSIAKK